MMMDESTIRILMSSDFMSSDSERGSTGGLRTARNQLRRINKILEKRHIETYCVEDAMHSTQSLKNRCTTESIPRDWFVRLQRLYAYFIKYRGTSSPLPLRSDQDPEDDEILEHILSSGFESHLICHGSEGYYVPVTFSKPVFDPSGDMGGWIGSLTYLLEELANLAPFLNISLRPVRGIVRRGGGYDVAEKEIRDLNAVFISKDEEDDDHFERERKAWFYLYETARISMITKAVLVMVSS